MQIPLVHTFAIKSVDTHIWHSRLGHLSDQRLAIIKDRLHCSVSKLLNNNPYFICSSS